MNVRALVPLPHDISGLYRVVGMCEHAGFPICTTHLPLSSTDIDQL